MTREDKLNRIMLYCSVLPIVVIEIAFLLLLLISGTATGTRLILNIIAILISVLPIIGVYELVHYKRNLFSSILKFLVTIFVLLIFNTKVLVYVIELFTVGGLWDPILVYPIILYQTYLLILAIVILVFDIRSTLASR